MVASVIIAFLPLPTEPAWHHSLRKKRAAARLLLQAASGKSSYKLQQQLQLAATLITTHHGSELPMTWKNYYGNGKGKGKGKGKQYSGNSYNPLHSYSMEGEWGQTNYAGMGGRNVQVNKRLKALEQQLANSLPPSPVHPVAWTCLKCGTGHHNSKLQFCRNHKCKHPNPNILQQGDAPHVSSFPPPLPTLGTPPPAGAAPAAVPAVTASTWGLNSAPHVVASLKKIGFQVKSAAAEDVIMQEASQTPADHIISSSEHISHAQHWYQHYLQQLGDQHQMTKNYKNMLDSLNSKYTPTLVAKTQKQFTDLVLELTKLKVGLEKQIQERRDQASKTQDHYRTLIAQSQQALEEGEKNIQAELEQVEQGLKHTQQQQESLAGKSDTSGMQGPPDQSTSGSPSPPLSSSSPSQTVNPTPEMLGHLYTFFSTHCGFQAPTDPGELSTQQAALAKFFASLTHSPPAPTSPSPSAVPAAPPQGPATADAPAPHVAEVVSSVGKGSTGLVKGTALEGKGGKAQMQASPY